MVKFQLVLFTQSEVDLIILCMEPCTGANHPMYGRTGANHPNFGIHQLMPMRDYLMFILLPVERAPLVQSAIKDGG